MSQQSEAKEGSVSKLLIMKTTDTLRVALEAKRIRASFNRLLILLRTTALPTFLLREKPALIIQGAFFCAAPDCFAGLTSITRDRVR